jgi:hypothetical protein
LASLVIFSGNGEVGVKVQETPAAVYSAWREAGGLPIPLTHDEGDTVYLNPATIAYWLEAPED